MTSAVVTKGVRERVKEAIGNGAVNAAVIRDATGLALAQIWNELHELKRTGEVISNASGFALGRGQAMPVKIIDPKTVPAPVARLVKGSAQSSSADAVEELDALAPLLPSPITQLIVVADEPEPHAETAGPGFTDRSAAHRASKEERAQKKVERAQKKVERAGRPSEVWRWNDPAAREAAIALRVEQGYAAPNRDAPQSANVSQAPNPAEPNGDIAPNSDLPPAAGSDDRAALRPGGVGASANDGRDDSRDFGRGRETATDSNAALIKRRVDVLEFGVDQSGDLAIIGERECIVLSPDAWLPLAKVLHALMPVFGAAL